MAIANKNFFNQLRQTRFKRGFTQSQVDGINSIVAEWNRQKLTDLRWLAYMLATVFHETAGTMQPIEEGGRGRGRRYGDKIKRSGVRYERPNKIYYGRGHVQLTWYENYENMGRLIGVDLLNKPELMLVPEVSIKVLFEGMMKGHSSFGDFTGKCLEMYFNGEVNDPEGARKIINGTDKADLIAGYHQDFFHALWA
jgi:hypothetical protein